MANPQRSLRDGNYEPTLIGVSSVSENTPVAVYVNPSTGAMLTETSIDASDIEIGAVEIKNSSDDTRATVDSNGLYVNPRTGFTLAPYDYVSLAQTSTTDVYTFKSGGSGGTTVATVTITYTDSTKVTISTVAKT